MRRWLASMLSLTRVMGWAEQEGGRYSPQVFIDCVAESSKFPCTSTSCPEHFHRRALTYDMLVGKRAFRVKDGACGRTQEWQVHDKLLTNHVAERKNPHGPRHDDQNLLQPTTSC